MSALFIGGGAKALPFDLALSIIPSLPRPMLARFVARAIERLDAEDGDCDLEANGDERDFSVAGWAMGRHGNDNDEAEDDDPLEDDDHSGEEAAL